MSVSSFSILVTEKVEFKLDFLINTVRFYVAFRKQINRSAIILQKPYMILELKMVALNRAPSIMLG